MPFLVITCHCFANAVESKFCGYFEISQKILPAKVSIFKVYLLYVGFFLEKNPTYLLLIQFLYSCVGIQRMPQFWMFRFVISFVLTDYGWFSSHNFYWIDPRLNLETQKWMKYGHIFVYNLPVAVQQIHRIRENNVWHEKYDCKEQKLAGQVCAQNGTWIC